MRRVDGTMEQDTQVTAPAARPSSRSPERLRTVGWGIVLVVVGVVWLLLALDVEVAWDLVLPVAVIIVGVLVMAVGRRANGDGLITFGVVLSVVALLVSFTPGAVTLTAGEQRHQVADLADLAAVDPLGAGSLTVDLRQLELPEGVTQLSTGVTFGELVVRVPADAVLAGSVRAAIGEVAIPDARHGGVAPRATLPDAAGLDGPVLELDLSVGIGRLEVAR